MKIVVLAGGVSTERDVSLSSGAMIYDALCRKGHETVMLDVYLGYQGEGADDIFHVKKDWTEAVGKIREENPDMETIKALRGNDSLSFFGENVIRICKQADIVFLALHGENGEDGRIQAAFDLMGIRYTGTDYLSSMLCMNKALTKELFFYHGIPAAKSFSLKKGETEKEKPSYPCMVKVCNGGSSVGVYICEDEEEYKKAKEEAYRFEKEIVVEQYIKGREFSVGVIDGKSLPVIEIAPLQGFYDYKNKYQAGSTIETCPAHISKGAEEKMRKAAEEAFRILRLKVYARMDFMMNEQEEIFCLETNTLPGMTSASLLPQEAKAAGTDFPELCEKLIELSLKKYCVKQG